MTYLTRVVQKDDDGTFMKIFHVTLMDRLILLVVFVLVVSG